MNDKPPPFDIDRVGGLFSERQIVLPLAVASLITLALSLTFLHVQTLVTLPAGLSRYLDNGYCQSMIALFVAILLYAMLQYLGLHAERLHLQQRFGTDEARQGSRLQDWLAYLSGRSMRDEETVAAALQRWSGQARDREDWTLVSDYLLMLRSQQHQHNFAPIGFAIWVLPLLGFIGTVIGITQAVSGLEASIIPSDGGASGLGGVLGGLAFAFDTTFVGLVLVIPTMLLLLILRARAQKLDMVYYRILLDRLFHDRPD
ncbi:MotA/TolQ/ExbB proton channel family protein [Thiobaca trueperi]|uniref:MotA/TolQ/ExbB proton channel family protein n=1 Tax=Thiobaca trueperi TaxID=127458 RepID=UPI001FB2A112|nr:MotA/TolQ/ExbB proton channel family protein [Thiobaca trueperi]